MGAEQDALDTPELSCYGLEAYLSIPFYHQAEHSVGKNHQLWDMVKRQEYELMFPTE